MRRVGLSGWLLWSTLAWIFGLAAQARGIVPMIWRRPANISSLDLFYGPGSPKRQPDAKRAFKFIEEDRDGTQPKFVAEDARGVRWKVKLGPEAHTETAATRLFWAAGYFVEELYYLPEIKVEGIEKLKRGRKYVGPGKVVRGARLERLDRKGDKAGNWSWASNPFKGSRELNGLRVMMALIDGWDLKETNNGIYCGPGNEIRYMVSDLGSSFGKVHGETDPPVIDWLFEDYRNYPESRFIKDVDREDVSFAIRPPIFAAAYYPRYRKHVRVISHIPRKDALWIGRLLAQLSRSQIADAFRAAGYSKRQVSLFSAVVQQRIKALNAL